MNRITHKQARRYMLADLDGLLTAAQLLDLETHLRDCEACRADSESFATLTARLQAEFHSRWDVHDGPSQNVLANVQSRSRRIIMQKRIDLAFNIFGGIVTLLVLLFVISSIVSQLQKKSLASNANQTNVPASPNLGTSHGDLIAFVSKQNGNNEIYTIKSDGSNLTNLTNNPVDDTFPVWSPDGMRIAFVSNRDGNENIYMMNFDGSNVIRLTDDTAQDTNPVWSPDGTKIAYISGDFSKNNTNIYVMDSNGQNQRRLTNYVPNTTVWPEAWSPDSQFILFNVYRQIVQVGINDGMVTPLTPQTDVYVPNHFNLSADGSTLTYLAECNSNDRGSKAFCNELRTISRYGTNVRTQAILKLDICIPKETKTFLKWSPDQTKILFAFTCGGTGWLYIANADRSDFKLLTNYPILGNMPDNEISTFDWSPDSQSIVFVSALDKPDNLYTLNINDALNDPSIKPTRITNSTALVSAPAWQPIPNNDVVEEKPTPQPTISFRFGDPVENKEQALIAAPSALRQSFNYVEPLVVVTVKQGSPEEFSKWAGSSSPAPKQIWVVVYFNEEWKSTFTASSSFAYNDQEVIVTIPPEMWTPPPPFRGCVVVVIDASNGHPVSVGSLPQGLIPECDK